MNKTLLLTGASAFALMLGMSAPSYAIDGAKANATGTSSGNTVSDLGSIRDNLTDGSWNGGATGIVHNQQNNGNNNAINAATAVHADVTGGTEIDSSAVASSDTADNGSEHFGNFPEGKRENEIDNTMNGFVGSATHQQNNGDNNAINAATAIDGVDGDTLGAATQMSKATGSAINNDGVNGPISRNVDSARDNIAEDSLNLSAGIITVQQNNGSNNGLSAATAAAGITGDGGDITRTPPPEARAWKIRRAKETDPARTTWQDCFKISSVLRRSSRTMAMRTA